MDARPHIWGTIDDEHCAWKMKDVVCGGILAWLKDGIPPFSTLTLAFGSLDVTLLAHDTT
jgi:hypothetical protein